MLHERVLDLVLKDIFLQADIMVWQQSDQENTGRLKTIATPGHGYGHQPGHVRVQQPPCHHERPRHELEASCF